MKELNLKEVSQYVEQNIGVFHQKRIQRLDGLKLSEVLKRKNPYIFKAKYVLTSEQIINKFTKEFANSFCKDNGEIDWDKLVRFNSATSTQRIARRAKVR
ncbi:MAG: PmeII family type II restriction endonuclease, partial [Candidatus Contendobacter sp.]|nr:PmeII family type II restriction endonuclease [Candidatus Contendobacter sp.]